MAKRNLNAEGFLISVRSKFNDPTHHIEISPYNETQFRAQTGIWGKRDQQDAKYALDQGAQTIGIIIHAWGWRNETDEIVSETTRRLQTIAEQFSGIRVEGTGKISRLTDLGGFIPKGSQATPMWRFPRSRIDTN